MSPRLIAALGASFLLVATRASADDTATPPPAVRLAGDAGAGRAVEPAPARNTRVGVEAGYGATTPTGGPPSRFAYQRATATHQLTPAVELALGARITEDLEAPRPPDPSSPYKTGSDVVTMINGRVGVDLSRRWSLTIGGLASPTSSRDIASSTASGSSSAYSLVRTRSSSLGAAAEIAYDSFDDEVDHDVDVEVALGTSVTRFASDQMVIAGSTGSGATGSASLLQGAATLATTLTFAQNSDIGVEGAVYMYDASDPGAVGSFDVTSRGATTSFGVGMPMLPMRWSVRPELAERLGRLTLRAGYQVAAIALTDAGLSHGVNARAQVALGDVKLYVAGGLRRDELDTSTTSDTWVASVGANVRF